MEASNVPALRQPGAVSTRSHGPANGEYLTFRLGAEEAVFSGAAHQPQLLGEPFNGWIVVGTVLVMSGAGK